MAAFSCWRVAVCVSAPVILQCHGTVPQGHHGRWHAAGTTRALLDLVAGEIGHPVGVRSVPKLAVRALGLVNPMLRGLAEMAYQFDEPFVLDTSKYQAAFGTAGSPLAAAVAATVAWYRARPGSVRRPDDHASG